MKQALVEVAGGRVTGDGEEDETGKEGRPHIMIDRNTSLGQDTAVDFFPEMPSSCTFALRILQFLQVNTCS